MATKKDAKQNLSSFMSQMNVRFEKLRKEAAVLAEKGGKELKKAGAIAKLEMDIMGQNLEKEKNYYIVGKKIASLAGKKASWEDVIDPFLETIKKIDAVIAKKKQEIEKVRKSA